MIEKKAAGNLQPTTGMILPIAGYQLPDAY